MARPPSGLFPGGPVRPSYREPHPVGAGSLLAGVFGGFLWFGLLGAIGRDLPGYVWWTLIATIVAWAVAVLLALRGDRGVAVGVAISTGLGLAIAVGTVVTRWLDTGVWPLW
ncbi:MAG TPA: hypothetical protein VFO77_15855 [Actinoplanes sp.]|nr:hypothetical protein [Actinoplanes sp.]